jgi:anti-sigma-K factor RskA
MTDHDQHTLSGAYALDALDGEERTRFEAHLATCADCCEEVASLQEAAALLGTDPVEPPASVRDAVLAGIESIRPLPPLTTETAPATPPARPDELTVRRTRRTLGQRLARTPLLAAAAVVLLLAVGTAWLRPWSDHTTDRQPALTVAEQVLAADDAETVDKSFPDGSHAAITVSERVGRAIIQTDDMAPAPAGKVYQLWFLNAAGEMISAGLMPPTPDTTLPLEGDVSRATGVGITVEPAGGSKQPTTKPIAVFNLDT